MKLETMEAAVAILERDNDEVSLEYPGAIYYPRNGWVYVFGDANENFGGDAYESWQEMEQGIQPELVTTPLPRDHADPADVAKAILAAVEAHQQGKPPRFHIFNETDQIMASPDAMTAAECDAFIAEFPARFARQGYYATATGHRIAPSEVRLAKVPA